MRASTCTQGPCAYDGGPEYCCADLMATCPHLSGGGSESAEIVYAIKNLALVGSPSGRDSLWHKQSRPVDGISPRWNEAGWEWVEHSLRLPPLPLRLLAI